ncbi:holo-ACP synthase [Gammaproteobacteria bacterium]|nr:holo-ACP synthase [Gammaproteobacteria bacterium]MDB2570171.1 holo-ACP synthase [Gammaproteobacteria bacterium]MDB2704538.1 holo-ACP synthase [Gammaproteobacteria bacterium]MDC3375583.1 holo-ACP synthase [Gammaproteobacteria bacterium]
MIYGIGTDIVNILRFKKMKSIKSFSEKILSEDEIKICSTFNEEKLIKYLAKQFACKEALSKAFGTGIRKPILFKELEILRDENGKPYFNPLGDVKNTLINLGITKTHVSLADESEYAIAFAILEI